VADLQIGRSNSAKILHRQSTKPPPVPPNYQFSESSVFFALCPLC